MQSFYEFYVHINEEIERLRDIAAHLMVINDVQPELFLAELIKFGDQAIYAEISDWIHQLKNKISNDEIIEEKDPHVIFQQAIGTLNNIIELYSGHHVKYSDGVRTPLKDFLGKTIATLQQLYESAPKKR